MSQRISDVAGWVFAHGAVAHELMFPERGHMCDRLSEVERSAVEGARPHVEQTIAAVLGATIDGLAQLAGGASNTATRPGSRRKASRAGSTRTLIVPLVPGRVEVGASLDTWGEPDWHLWLFCLIDADHQARAHEAVRARLDAANLPGLSREQQAIAFRTNDVGSVLIGHRAPRAGEAVDAYGKEAATLLWSFAAPISAAVRR